jgi:competence CoiA-like predicted nuclease
MPLRAIFDNQELLAPLLSDQEWEELKRKRVKVTLPCCEARGYLRTSKRGIKHFVHNKKDGCTSGTETWQHLLCKTEIARACKAMGYDVKTEASGEDWRADVLATKQGENGLIKLAFEVQWSPQTLEETEQRQQKYTRDGIRCCWLFKNLPTRQARQDIPMFQLQFDDQDIPMVNTYTKCFELQNFITELLLHHFRFCQYYLYQKRQNIRIRFFPVNCWKCHRTHHIYHVIDQSYKSICNCHLFSLGDGFIISDPQFLPEIINKAYECLKTEKAKQNNMKMGKIKPRYSKTIGRYYTSFGCPYCNAIFGDHFYFDEICNVEYGYVEPIDFDVTINIPLEKEDDSHWCYSETQTFCCNSNL